MDAESSAGSPAVGASTLSTCSSSGVPELAAAVCSQCKRRKKRCDKVLPCCGRCSRLSMRCNYSGDTVENPTLSPGAEYKILKSNLSWNWPDARPLPELVSPFSFIASLPSFQVDACLSEGHRKLLNFNEQLTTQSLEIITRNGSDIGAVCEDYFVKITKWFPIISRKEVFSRLPTVYAAPDAHFSVLLVCMYLFTQFWLKESSDDLDALYFTAKGFHSLLQSTGRVTTEGLQAGLLIAVYEHTQRFTDSASLTIGSCARMGYALGLHKTINPNFDPTSMSEIEVEDKRRLWWGVVIFERVMSFNNAEILLPFASQNPKYLDHLPMDGSFGENVIGPPTVSGRHIPVSTGLYSEASTSLGPNPTSAQGAYFLSSVFEHIETSFDSLEAQQASADAIDGGLRALIMSMLDPPWKGVCLYCGGYTISVSALLCLYQHQLNSTVNVPYLIDTHIRTILAAKSMVRMVIQTLQSSRDEFEDVLVWDLLPAWAFYLVYMTGILRIRILQPGEDDFLWSIDLKIIRSFFQYFQPKMRIAAFYLEALEKALAANKCSWNSCRESAPLKSMQMPTF